MNNLYWPVYKQLEREVMSLSFDIHFDDKQFEFITESKEHGTKYIKTPPYSLRVCDLIIRCCNELEAVIKALTIYSDEEIKGIPTFKRDKEITSATRFSYLNDLWKLNKKIVQVSCPNMFFEKKENNEFAPFDYKKDSVNDFWSAYNAIKHSRSNKTIYKGNIYILLRSMAALYLINLYYKDKNKVFTIGADDEFDAAMRGNVPDFSRGSKIFHVRSYDISTMHVDYESEWFQSATYIQMLSPAQYIANLKALHYSGKIEIRKIPQNSSFKSGSYLRGEEYSRQLTFRSPDGLVKYCEYKNSDVPYLDWWLITTLNTNQQFDFFNFTDENNDVWIKRIENELGKLNIYNTIKIVF